MLRRVAATKMRFGIGDAAAEAFGEVAQAEKTTSTT